MKHECRCVSVGEWVYLMLENNSNNSNDAYWLLSMGVVMYMFIDIFALKVSSSGL